ncbi:hypothetical protein [Inhella sp.]|uniref:hypothetical protein n=1 Tax=Inhella sp. TaxID=1921806 RepID=UPI0035AE217A
MSSLLKVMRKSSLRAILSRPIRDGHDLARGPVRPLSGHEALCEVVVNAKHHSVGIRDRVGQLQVHQLDARKQPVVTVS